jgi:hypothetical protein
MSDVPRYVLDTNIFVSALLFRSSQPRQALDKARKSGILLMSQALRREVENVLSRPKFDRYLTQTERQLFLMGLLTQAEFVDTQETISVCRDPKDNMLLELAISGEAKIIVSGDRDLLVLNQFNDIAILTVKQFLDQE